MKIDKRSLSFLPDEYFDMVRSLAKPGKDIIATAHASKWEAMQLACDLAVITSKMFRNSWKSDYPNKEGENENVAYYVHIAGALFGEVGELYDTIKKWVIYNKDLDRGNIIEEFGDILFYLTALVAGPLPSKYTSDIDDCVSCLLQLEIPLEVDINEAWKQNMEKLAKRYDGYKYSDQAAQERADKQLTKS